VIGDPVLVVLLAWLLLVTVVAGALLLVSRKSDSPGITLRRPKPETPGAWLDSVTLRRLVVHTTDDHSMEGLLASNSPDGIVLVHAKLLGEKTVEMGGQVWVPRGQVLMIQTMPVV
jgi:hypothetical protein